MFPRPVFLLIAICFLLFSCQEPESEDSGTSLANLTSTSVFPLEPMQILNKDLRLSFIGKTETDSSNFYQVVATYEGQQVGFNLSVPLADSSSVIFSSRGKESDKFLQVLQKVYRFPVDSTARFKDYISADYSSIAKVFRSDSVAAPGVRSRLVLHDAADSNTKAELFLNVNEKGHLVEFAEKDSVFRAGLIRLFTQK